jgi:hypothetical protein
LVNSGHTTKPTYVNNCSFKILFPLVFRNTLN